MEHSIRILGTNGTKGLNGGTSSFYIDSKNVIDAGNLLIPLGAKSAEIETIWLTHSHLDHIIDIAYILDSYFSERKRPLVLRGLASTLDAVKEHFFNDIIWPDFSLIPLGKEEGMAVEYEPIEIGTKYTLENGSLLEAIETDHTVPSCGYVVTQDQNALLISADTLSLKSVLAYIIEHRYVKSMVIECSFPSSMEHLARVSKHLTPKILFESLKSIENSGITLYINHIKPLHKKIIVEEIALYKGAWKVKILEDGDKIHF